MTQFPIIFLISVGVLLLAAFLRWFFTPPTAQERSERRDLVCLLFCITLGQGGSMVRDHYKSGSPGYWIASILLLPVCGFALYYIRQLFGAYRGLPPPVARPTARVLKPPKLDPPKADKGSRKR